MGIVILNAVRLHCFKRNILSPNNVFMILVSDNGTKQHIHQSVDFKETHSNDLPNTYKGILDNTTTVCVSMHNC